MVDPGRLALNFLSSGPLGYSEGDFPTRAKGVVTISLKGSPPESSSDHHGEPVMLYQRLHFFFSTHSTFLDLFFIPPSLFVPPSISLCLPPSFVPLSSSPLPPPPPPPDPRRWLTITLGTQKHQLNLPVVREEWHATYPFLVHELQEEVVRLRYSLDMTSILSV